jgi:hypothetical protein
MMFCELGSARWLCALLLSLGLLLSYAEQRVMAQEVLPRINLKAEALPNFQVRLTWTAPSSDTEFEIVRNRVDASDLPTTVPVPWRSGVPGFGPSEGREQSYIDSAVLPLTVYSYQIRPPVTNGGGPWEQSDVSVIGNEVIVDGRTDLAALNFKGPVHRLWLRTGAELITHGLNVDLELIELRADGATILTFVEGAEASAGLKGKDGGSIRIATQRATGTSLALVMRGEKGGKGQPGISGNVGANGSSGQNARFQISFNNFNNIDKFCRPPAGNGTDGRDGQPGQPGEPGASGGNSGQITILIKEKSMLKIDVLQQPGSGGQGGPGGVGGNGGQGGQGGSPDGACPPGAAGMPGKQGAPGTAGADGPPGAKEAYCIINENGIC